MKLTHVLFALLVSCVPVAPVSPDADVGCEKACAHLAALKCEEAEPTPNGATCFEWCDNAERNFNDMHTGCINSATSCDAARECFE